MPSASALDIVLMDLTSPQATRPLVIFDLDSTLFDLTQRVAAILKHYTEHPVAQAKFADALERLKHVEIRRTDWGIIEPLERLNLNRATHPELIADVQAAWAKGFFSNDFLNLDQPIEGAVEFVESCLSAGADVLYLTGRDIARMQNGTEASLRQHRLPLDGAKAKLHLKPHKSLDDALFKTDVIEDLVRQHDTVWLFENEPVNINAVLRRTPSVKTVLLETCHSGLEEVPEGILRVKNFTRAEGKTPTGPAGQWP